MGSGWVRVFVGLACMAAVGCMEASGTASSRDDARDGGGSDAGLGSDASGRRLDLRDPHMQGRDAGEDAKAPLDSGVSDAAPSRDAGESKDAADDADDPRDASTPEDGEGDEGPDVQSRLVTFRTSPSVGSRSHALPFAPKAVLCFGAPLTNELPQKGSAGFVTIADGVTTVGIADAMTDDNTVSSRRIDVERGIIIRPGQEAPAVRYAVQLSSTGFSLQYEQTDGESYTMGCLALGGADVTATVVAVSSELGVVRDLPVKPELIFAIAPGDGDAEGGSEGDDHPLNSFGVCDAESLSQWWFGMYSDDRADGKRSHVVEGKLVGETMFWNSALTTVYDDGFAWEPGGGDDTVAFLAVNVAGVPRRVGLFQAETDTEESTEQELPDLGFTAQAMGFVSASREVLTGIGPLDNSHAAQALGMVDGQLRQAALSRFTELGADNADQRWTGGKVLGIPTADAYHGALGELVDLSDSTPTLRWSRADGKRYRIGYFALGAP